MLGFANTVHQKLKLSVEEEESLRGISLLELNLSSSTGKIELSWYRKWTDTGAVLNYHSICPKNLNIGLSFRFFLHRIFNSSSGWAQFHEGISRAQDPSQTIQYRKAVIQNTTNATLTRLVSPVKKAHDRPTTTSSGVSYSLKLSYRGVQSERLAQHLRNKLGDNSIYSTNDKLRSDLSGVKAAVPSDIRSHLNYENT